MKRIIDAIRSTPVGYFTDVLLQRNPSPQALGSQFLDAQDFHSLISAQWEPYDHPAIKAPAVGFKAKIPGLFGVLPVKECSRKYSMELSPDRKGNGYMEVVVTVPFSDLPTVLDHRDFSTLLIGPASDAPDAKEVVWAVFPGEPIAPSSMKVDGAARPITAEEAQLLGFDFAKVRVG